MFHLDSKEYSVYPAEQEVLLQEGLQYDVISVEVKKELVKN